VPLPTLRDALGPGRGLPAEGSEPHARVAEAAAGVQGEPMILPRPIPSTLGDPEPTAYTVEDVGDPLVLTGCPTARYFRYAYVPLRRVTVEDEPELRAEAGE